MSEVMTERPLMLWVVVTNGNYDQTYVFTEPEKAFESVVAGVRAYLDPFDELPDIGATMAAFRRTIFDRWDDVVIPFQMGGLYMVIHRIELDRHNPLHQLLREVFDVLEGVDGERAVRLRESVAALFRPSLSE